MTISSISKSYAVQQAYALRNTYSSAATAASSGNASGDSVSISETAYHALAAADKQVSDSASTKRDVGYDVTNMSWSDVKDMGKELLSKGAINELEYMTMIYDPTQGGKGIIKFSDDVTYHNGNINLLKIQQMDVDFSKSAGDKTGLAMKERMLDIYKNINSTINKS